MRIKEIKVDFFLSMMFNGVVVFFSNAVLVKEFNL